MKIGVIGGGAWGTALAQVAARRQLRQRGLLVRRHDVEGHGRPGHACDCADGDVLISHEHSGARWIDPVEYRERYFSDNSLAPASGSVRAMLLNIRAAIDAYLVWRRLAG